MAARAESGMADAESFDGTKEEICIVGCVFIHLHTSNLGCIPQVVCILARMNYGVLHQSMYIYDWVMVIEG